MKAHAPRGFALPIVFLVLLLLSIAFVGLADTVVVGSQAAGGRIDRQKKFYACEGVVRLASGITRDIVLDDPDADTIDLNAALEPVRDIAIESGIDLSQPTHGVDTVTVLDSGALEGLEVIQSSASFQVSADPSVGCSLNLSQPVGSISPLQFTAFSTETAQIPPGLTPLQPTDPPFAWGRTLMAVPAASRIDSVDENQAPVRLPVPGEGDPPGDRGVVTRQRTFRSYTQVPFTNNAAHTPERPSSRIAYQSDIRIIDGEWYVRDPANALAWPGIPMWADHPCDSDATPTKLCAATYTDDTTAGGFTAATPSKRRLYSLYERTATGLQDDVERGVVSYGRIVDNEAAVMSDATVCPPAAPSALRREDQCPQPQHKRILLEAARTPIADPSGAAILPINIDVGMLGAALATTVNGEAGATVCITGVAGCRRPFNGIVYVTSTKGVAPTTSPGALPYALCGGADTSVDNGTVAGTFPAQACASAVRYNAVRLYDAGDVSVFAATGLTIASDLPVYTYGDWNVVGNSRRTLIMGDRLTALSNLWRDDGSVSSGGHAFLNASLLFGFGPSHKIPDLVRTVESSVDVRVVGGMVAGFTSARPIGPGQPFRSFALFQPPELVHPQNDFQPPGVPRVSLGLPIEIADDIAMGGCGGGI